MAINVVDGKKISEEIFAKLKEDIKSFANPPRLGIILAGEDPASKAYVEQKKKRGEEIGVKVDIFPYPKETSAKKLRAEVGRIARLPNMRGLIVQLPLPENIEETRVLNAIPPRLDVDVLGKTAFGAFALGTSPITPPTVAGILHIFSKYNIELKGKSIAIVGNGRLVGMPMALEAARRGAVVHIINQSTKNPENIVKTADIVVTGTPAPEHITADMLKDGAVVIDGGFVRTSSGKIVGNVAFEEATKKASLITPVPGGVGALTVAMLFANLFILTKTSEVSLKSR